MSVEVEILSRVLAYRLSGVAPALIHPTQAGFERGRSMRDHIIFIEALQHKATKEQAEWCATFLDFAKAYDWVNQHFLFDFMAKMNIGSNFLSWIRLLYHRPQVNFLLNGPSVYPNRGVKQGCTLLRLLFDLYIEPLGATLRVAPDLGIPVGEGDPLTSIFFADDSTILSNSLESAEYQVDYIVRTFCETSGAPLNLHNNREVPAGRHSTPSITLASSRIPIKYLGIFVGHQIQLIHGKYLSAYTKWTYQSKDVESSPRLSFSHISGM
ncbi:hypothetical protein AeMF1_014571 [Aphanomyces euteiches]|nr:hypothetical protein AeMF1_014571 [Aphanomyces euteiches]KAH9182058.1 hypothetical protein AeNC1_015967 [Aphanomyces euteiches]